MQQTKFLLLLGPSGVGKSTIIRDLQEMENSFVYISPYITRSLRKGEVDKIPISNQEMDERAAKGEFMVINSFYGIRYATPREAIERALNTGQFPLLDWPVSRMDVAQAAFPDRLFVVYVSPPSLEVLQGRLARDGRDPHGQRYRAAEEELNRYWQGDYDSFCNFKVVSIENTAHEVTEQIYQAYLADLVN